MTPIEAYQEDLINRGFQPDAVQESAVALTQNLYDTLLSYQANPQSANYNEAQFSLLGLLKSPFKSPFTSQRKTPIKGLYFWGGVGRGKSYLIDTFFNCLPFHDKKRVHFNQFMQNIHSRLKNLPKTPNPLIIVSSEIAKECQVLCIDEFHVDDITDAMIMAGLLDALFNCGVTLVVTSNIAPKHLYKNGLQRDRFIPAIDLIIEHTQTFHLDNGLDYRLALLEKHGTFHVLDPSDKSLTSNNFNEADVLHQQMLALSNAPMVENTEIELNHRTIKCRARSDNHIWFDFKEICETPRSSADYILLATDFETILISNIPVMDDGKNDVVQRFIHLVDAIYDQHVKLIATAEVSPNKLYTGKGLQFPFQRTESRLHEMRSSKYLSHSHNN